MRLLEAYERCAPNRWVSEEATQLASRPVRNVWFLFLYAYDPRFQGRFEAEVEDSPDFKIARLLCHVVETRLRRNLRLP